MSDAAPVSKQVRHRRRLMAEGWRQVNVLLPPHASRTLDAICQRTGESQAALLERLLEAEQEKTSVD